ncbi:MAG: DUF11 domain-containing protein [Chloroflexota bacterium]|nr:DUF11 domain-containing protein [Chloroflexota bacterium]
MKRFYIVLFIPLYVLALALLSMPTSFAHMVGRPAVASEPSTFSMEMLQGGPPETVTLENGYRISFLGVDYEADGTSVWQYEVEELPSAQDLSNWVLALPGCVNVLDAGPEPWELVNPDPNAQLSGIKWQTGAGFQEGIFTLTLDEHWAVGTTDVAAKGPDLAYGEIAGPICEIGEEEPELDIDLDKSVDPTVAQAGDELEYTIVVHNDTDDVDADDLVLIDLIPAGTAYVAGSAQSDEGIVLYDEDDDLIRWEGDLDEDETATIIFRVEVDEDVDPGTVIENRVYVEDAEDIDATATTTIEAAEIFIDFEKTVEPTEALPDDELTYTILVDNETADLAEDLVVHDPIPAGTTYIADSVQADEGIVAYDAEDDLIRWQGDLAPGEAATITFQARVHDYLPPAATVFNAAYLGDEIATATTRIGDLPDTVTFANGYQITFLGVDYEADGTSVWQYHVEELPAAQDLSHWVLGLPACVEVLDAEPDPWELVTPDPDTGVDGIKWETGAGFAEGIFTLTLDEPWDVGVTDVAVVGPDEAFGEIAGPECEQVAQLELDKRADVAVVQPGEAFNYTLTVTNQGGTPANDIVLYDPIAAPLSYLAGTAAATSGVVEYDAAADHIRWQGDLAPGESATITFAVRVHDYVPLGTTITSAAYAGNTTATATVTVGTHASQLYLPLVIR